MSLTQVNIISIAEPRNYFDFEYNLERKTITLTRKGNHCKDIVFNIPQDIDGVTIIDKSISNINAHTRDVNRREPRTTNQYNLSREQSLEETTPTYRGVSNNEINQVIQKRR